MNSSNAIIFGLVLLLLFGCTTPDDSPAGLESDELNSDTDEVDEVSDESPVSENPQTDAEIAVIETSKGVIEVELNRNAAPITVDNFVSYVDSGFYSGTVFHRVIPGFMVQGGGFTADGIQKETNAPIKLESDNGLSNKKGTIAMARTMVKDSATSQFFINTVDNPFLNHAPGNDGYAVFGTVISGMDIVEDIESVKTGVFKGYQDWPTETVTIERIYMKE
jgi:peptidyl-prolyl cis-trans isomerase B (cyclophilin B)